MQRDCPLPNLRTVVNPKVVCRDPTEAANKTRPGGKRGTSGAERGDRKSRHSPRRPDREKMKRRRHPGSVHSVPKKGHKAITGVLRDQTSLWTPVLGSHSSWSTIQPVQARLPSPGQRTQWIHDGSMETGISFHFSVMCLPRVGICILYPYEYFSAR